MNRAYCYKCYRAKKTCLCNIVPVIDNDIQVYILQHPDEIKNAKGTSIIAGLYLKNIVSWQGEDFSQHKQLNELLEKQSDSTLVVYPDASAVSIDNWVEQTLLYKKNKDLCRYNLIFIDASWRKAKKIWHSSPLLQNIESICLPQQNESNYRIRKIPEAGYVSTIEAIVTCLECLENDNEKYKPLSHVFDKMIDEQISNMGEQVYQRNYKKE